MQRKIVIKSCDKGAGVIILDLDEYLRACYIHLTSKVKPEQPYYTPVDEFEVERAKVKKKNIIQEGLDRDIITKLEADAILL